MRNLLRTAYAAHEGRGGLDSDPGRTSAELVGVRELIGQSTILLAVAGRRPRASRSLIEFLPQVSRRVCHLPATPSFPTAIGSLDGGGGELF